MDELLDHLRPENEQAVLKPLGFGEVTRILYRNLYVVVSGKATSIRISSDYIEFYRNDALVGQTPIHAFKNAQITFREKLVRVLEKDVILARHLHIAKHTDEEIVADFIYDSVQPT